jgi:hypothetical protein
MFNSIKHTVNNTITDLIARKDSILKSVATIPAETHISEEGSNAESSEDVKQLDTTILQESAPKVEIKEMPPSVLIR